MDSEEYIPHSFVPISLDEFVQKLIRDNPDHKEEEVRERLKHAVSLKKEGIKCINCRKPIWAIGSALAEVPMCFTCITGEAIAEDDYEIDEVC